MKTSETIAKIMSVVFYPLFMPTYGMALFGYAYSQHGIVPVIWIILTLLFTFFFTALLPIGSIWLLMKRGQVSSMQIENASERSMPYLYSAVGFGCWAYMLIAKLHAPLFIGTVAIGATLAIGMVAIINRRWKISAHLTGMGGLFGGFLSYCLGVGSMPSWGLLGGWFALSLLIMYARLRLNAHTSEQVAAGWLLGLSCTFAPYALLYYVL